MVSKSSPQNRILTVYFKNYFRIVFILLMISVTLQLFNHAYWPLLAKATLLLLIIAPLLKIVILTGLYFINREKLMAMISLLAFLALLISAVLGLKK